MKARWSQHKALLNMGKHHTPRLQNLWNKDGAQYFDYRVIETCLSDPETLIAREQLWIDKTNKQGLLLNGRLNAKFYDTAEPVCVTCDFCGGVFQTGWDVLKRRFCSRSCVMKARRRDGLDVEERSCESCGKPFKIEKYFKQRCCSPKCNSGLRKLSLDDIVPILRRSVSGESFLSIGRQYGVSGNTIGRVVHRKSWTNVEIPDDIKHLFIGDSIKTTRSQIEKRRLRSRSRFTDDQVVKIKALQRDGLSDTEIACLYGVHSALIWSIRVGRTFKEIE